VTRNLVLPLTLSLPSGLCASGCVTVFNFKRLSQSQTPCLLFNGPCLKMTLGQDPMRRACKWIFTVVIFFLTFKTRRSEKMKAPL
jgi:hypothetical protein